LQLLVTWPVNH